MVEHLQLAIAFDRPAGAFVKNASALSIMSSTASAWSELIAAAAQRTPRQSCGRLVIVFDRVPQPGSTKFSLQLRSAQATPASCGFFKNRLQIFGSSLLCAHILRHSEANESGDSRISKTSGH